MAEGARLEVVYARKRIVGSNPTSSDRRGVDENPKGFDAAKTAGRSRRERSPKGTKAKAGAYPTSSDMPISQRVGYKILVKKKNLLGIPSKKVFLCVVHFAITRNLKSRIHETPRI